MGEAYIINPVRERRKEEKKNKEKCSSANPSDVHDAIDRKKKCKQENCQSRSHDVINLLLRKQRTLHQMFFSFLKCFSTDEHLEVDVKVEAE